MTPRPRPRSRSRRVSVGHTATTRPRLMLAPVWEKRGQKCKGIKNVGEKSGTGRHFWARQQSPARATRQGRLKSTQINICLGAHATGMGDASADAHPAPRGSRRNKAVEQLSLSCTLCREVCLCNGNRQTSRQSVHDRGLSVHPQARPLVFTQLWAGACTLHSRSHTDFQRAFSRVRAKTHIRASTHTHTPSAGRGHAHRHAQGVNTC